MNTAAQDSPTVKITLPVEGMTCAACQANVQRALTAAPGVTQAAVNLMTHEATVSFDPAATDPARIVAAINDTGYRSRVPVAGEAPPDEDENERAQRREYVTLRTKSLVSLAMGAAAMVASMPLMGGALPHAAHTGDALLRWAMTAVDPPVREALPWLYAIDPNSLTLGLLAATVLVMAWAGHHFYTRAWAGLRHRSADMNTLIAVGTGAAFLYSVAATLAPGWFAADGGGSHVEGRGLVDRGADDTVANGLLHRHRLPSQHRLVHCAAAARDLAVHREAFPRAHYHDVAETNVGDGQILLAAVAPHAGG